MKRFICTTCGTQFAPSDAPPEQCPICQDDRQYVGPEGQQWTTLCDMQAGGHRNRFLEYEARLTGIGTEPRFAIGQRALLVQTDAGNVLWDCISFLDDETIERVHTLGGVDAIAISHPHFFACMNEWSAAFGGVPIWLNADDRRWVQAPGPNIRYWGEQHTLWPGLELIQCGGHFPGSSVLHWADGADGRGVLLVGDTLQVGADRKAVSVMHSYPNFIPVTPDQLDALVLSLQGLEFDRVYGMYWDSVIPSLAHQIVRASLDQYRARLSGGYVDSAGA